MAREGDVTLFPTVAALWNTRVHRGASNCSNVSPKVKGSVDDSLSFGAILRIPYVNPDNSHVRVSGCTYDSRTSSKCDTMEHFSF